MKLTDLYDLAMIVDQLTFDPKVPTEAPRGQERLRRMKLPAQLAEPAPGWADAYGEQMQKSPRAMAPFIDFEQAITVMAQVVHQSLPASAT